MPRYSPQIALDTKAACQCGQDSPRFQLAPEKGGALVFYNKSMALEATRRRPAREQKNMVSNWLWPVLTLEG